MLPHSPSQSGRDSSPEGAPLQALPREDPTAFSGSRRLPGPSRYGLMADVHRPAKATSGGQNRRRRSLCSSGVLEDTSNFTSLFMKMAYGLLKIQIQLKTVHYTATKNCMAATPAAGGASGGDLTSFRIIAKAACHPPTRTPQFQPKPRTLHRPVCTDLASRGSPHPLPLGGEHRPGEGLHSMRRTTTGITFIETGTENGGRSVCATSVSLGVLCRRDDPRVYRAFSLRHGQADVPSNVHALP